MNQEEKIEILPYIDHLLVSGVDFCKRIRAYTWNASLLLRSFLPSAAFAHATVFPVDQVGLLALPRDVPLWFDFLVTVMIASCHPTPRIRQLNAVDLEYDSIIEAFVKAGGAVGDLEFVTTISNCNPPKYSDFAVELRSRLSIKDALHLLRPRLAIEQIMTDLLEDGGSYSGIIYDEIRICYKDIDKPKTIVSIDSQRQSKLAKLVPYPLGHIGLYPTNERYLHPEGWSSNRQLLTCVFNDGTIPASRLQEELQRRVELVATIAEVLEVEGFQQPPRFQSFGLVTQDRYEPNKGAFRWFASSDFFESFEGSTVSEPVPAKWKTLFTFLHRISTPHRLIDSSPSSDVSEDDRAF